LLLGVFVQRRSLARYSFDSWGIKKLVRRLVTPRVTTEPAVSQETGKASSLEELYGRITRPVNDNNNDRHDHLFQEHGKNQMSESFLALVHDDIFDMLDKEDFKERLLHGLNCRVDTILRTGLDADAEADQTATFKESVAGILLLQEAWLPPIREILAFILKVRTRTPEIPLVVVLIGKPGPDTLLTVPDSQDKKIWAVKIKGLGDPLIDVEDLVTQ
jgi:hypothetical protein